MELPNRQVIMLGTNEIPHTSIIIKEGAVSTCHIKLNVETQVLDKAGREIATLPARCVSDGANIPYALRLVFPVWGEYTLPVLVHDYWSKKARDDKIWSYREYCDDNFSDWAIQCGVNPRRAKAMGGGVTAYGKFNKLRGVYK